MADDINDDFAAVDPSGEETARTARKTGNLPLLFRCAAGRKMRICAVKTARLLFSRCI
jgi:hypothetical protein